MKKNLFPPQQRWITEQTSEKPCFWISLAAETVPHRWDWKYTEQADGLQGRGGHISSFGSEEGCRLPILGVHTTVWHPHWFSVRGPWECLVQEEFTSLLGPGMYCTNPRYSVLASFPKLVEKLGTYKEVLWTQGFSIRKTSITARLTSFWAICVSLKGMT